MHFFLCLSSTFGCLNSEQDCYLNFSIDATFSSGLGRMVNDLPAKKSNCKMKKLEVSGRVWLCLFATKNILPNTELRYDYGVKDLPWRFNCGMFLCCHIVHCAVV